MSIYAYTGLPGSGKSYDVVANQILPALKAGRHVVTNVPLHLDELRKLVPEAKVSEFPTEQVQGAPELIDQWAAPGCVLVLDEVWRLWPAGQKANQVPEPFRKLLAEHRHMVDAAGNAMQIVLVTQDLAQIGAFARQLVEQTFHHTKLTHVGMAGSYRIDVYNGPQSGPNPPKSARLREVFGRYDKAIFKLYRSHTMSEAATGGANEKSMDARGNVLHRPLLYVGFAFVIAAIIWGIPQVKKAFNPETPAPLRKQQAPSLAPGAPAPARGAYTVMPPATWEVAADIPELHWTAISDGARFVILRGPSWCDRDADGGVWCTWNGQRISNEVRRVFPAYVPQARPAAQESASAE